MAGLNAAALIHVFAFKPAIKKLEFLRPFRPRVHPVLCHSQHLSPTQGRGASRQIHMQAVRRQRRLSGYLEREFRSGFAFVLRVQRHGPNVHLPSIRQSVDID